MCKYKTRVIDKKMCNAIRQAVKSGCVVEREQGTGDIMQVFYNNGNILKRTFRKDTKQWGSISVCRNLNWMGSYGWHVIQDEEGRDLHFGDTSQYKVLPPFIKRDCECMESDVPEPEPEPEPEQAAKPEPEPETEAPEKSRVDLIMQIAHDLADKYGMDEHQILMELTGIQKENQFKDIKDLVSVFEDRVSNNPVPVGMGCIEALVAGRTVRLGEVEYRMRNGVLAECRPGYSTFTESHTSFNTIISSAWTADEYKLTFDEAVAEMEAGKECIPEGMNMRFKVADGSIMRVDRAPGMPIYVMKGMWRVREE